MVLILVLVEEPCMGWTDAFLVVGDYINSVDQLYFVKTLLYDERKTSVQAVLLGYLD